MNKSPRKFQKLGVVLKNEKGPFILMGDSKNTNQTFNYEVELIVRNSAGEEITRVKNPLISLFDPRKRPNITEAQLARISEKHRYDVVVALEE